MVLYILSKFAKQEYLKKINNIFFFKFLKIKLELKIAAFV